MLNVAVVGHVDHGKSTLIGRLLYDTDSLPHERIEEIKRTCRELGKKLEFAYIGDALEEERINEMTIDTTQTFFKSKKRSYSLIDAPGHKEFLKNMVTGVSQADVGILIVDVKEGVKEQTKRHAYLLKLLGIPSVIVAINKMDLIDYSKERFEEVKKEVETYLLSIGLKPKFIIPISAYNGENIVFPSKEMKWCGITLLEALEKLERPHIKETFRFIVQDEFDGIYLGNIISGKLHVNERVARYPQGDEVEIKTILTDREVEEVEAPKAIGIKCNKQLERGDVLTKSKPNVTREIKTLVFLLKDALKEKEELLLRCATQESLCKIKQIKEKINIETLEKTSANELKETDIGVVEIMLKKPLVFESISHAKELGRFVLVKNHEIVAGGIIP